MNKIKNKIILINIQCLKKVKKLSKINLILIQWSEILQEIGKNHYICLINKRLEIIWNGIS